jgi:hypothetical protein
LFYLTDLTGTEARPGETSDREFSGMIVRDNLSDRRDSRAMGPRYYPMRFGTIGRDHFHGGYCQTNHSRNYVPLSE